MNDELRFQGDLLAQQLRFEFEEKVAQIQANAGKTFPEEEIETFYEIVELVKTASEEIARTCLFVTGSMIVQSLELGFLPSEFEKSRKRIHSRIHTKSLDEDIFEEFTIATRSDSEERFWVGCGLFCAEKWDQAVIEFDSALQDRLLWRKMILASLQFKAWCHMNLGQYDEALSALQTAADNLNTSEGKLKIESIMRFITTLQKYGLEAKEPVFAILPADEFEEYRPVETSAKFPSTEALFQMMNKLSEIDEKVSQFSQFPQLAQMILQAKAIAFTITPEEPYSNRLKLRQVLRGCESYIWYVDKHFAALGLEQLFVGIDSARVREVRILSGRDNVDYRAKDDFRRFYDELKRKCVFAEWRILHRDDCGLIHDRFILSKNSCYNVPPINSLLKGQRSEILQTPHRPPFEHWWQRASKIGNISQSKRVTM